MISVRLYATLAPRAATGARPSQGSAEFQLEARPGLRVRDILVQRDLPVERVQVVTVNNLRAGLDTALVDGDQVGLFPALSGG